MSIPVTMMLMEITARCSLPVSYLHEADAVEGTMREAAGKCGITDVTVRVAPADPGSESELCEVTVTGYIETNSEVQGIRAETALEKAVASHPDVSGVYIS